MNLRDRLMRIERQIPSIQRETPWLVIVHDETGRPSEAALDKVKGQYRKEHPEYDGENFNTIWVVNQECKEMTEWIIAGHLPREKS